MTDQPRRSSLGRALQRRVPAAFGLALAVGLLTGAGCSVVRHGTSATQSVLGSITGAGSGANPTNGLDQVQSEVMREADLYVGAVAQATDDLRAAVPTIEARNMGQQWKLTQATAAYIDASGEHPLVNAVDLLVLASLSRCVVEDYWVGEKFGEAARPLLETHRTLESNAWAVVQVILTPDQQREVRALLEEYRQRYPQLRSVAAVRVRELTGILGQLPNRNEDRTRRSSLFSLLYLDPLAGLDPATQAIQQTRLLAVRALYYAQRTPMLLSWQAELTLYQLAAQPETRQVLSDLNDFGQTAKVFAQTAEGLTNLVNAQREAAINQIFDRLAVEQTNLLAGLAREETKFRGLLDETRQTLDAGSNMATSVNAAIRSLDAFVRYVSPPDTNPPPAAPDTNSRPFNVLDYGTAATQIGDMATNLTTLVQTVNQSEAQISRLSQQATTDLRRVVDHAFRLGLVLVAVTGGVAWLVVRTCRRPARKPPDPPPPTSR